MKNEELRTYSLSEEDSNFSKLTEFRDGIRKLVGVGEESIPFLVDLFSSANNIWALNSIAIGLADLQTVSCKSLIVDKIENSKYFDRSGSLIYALESFDCRDIHSRVVVWLCLGNYEMQLSCFGILKKSYKVSSKSEKKKMRYSVVREVGNVFRKENIDPEKRKRKKDIIDHLVWWTFK
jgi:hypothetical protein